MSQPRKTLQQIDMDAAEKNMVTGDTVLVGADGRVNRLQKTIDALGDHRFGDRVVVHAATAKHPSSTGC